MSGEPLSVDVVRRLAQHRRLRGAAPMPTNRPSAIDNTPKPLPAPPSRTPPVVQTIKDIVCLQAGLTAVELVSDRRSRTVSWPRFIAMDMCRKYSTLSLPRIGHMFGGKDHTSVMHGLRRCEILRDPNSKRHVARFARLYREIEAACDDAFAPETDNDAPAT